MIIPMLQQYLPFTVLKLVNTILEVKIIYVATVLTVYGIETLVLAFLATTILLQQYLPFTVLKLQYILGLIRRRCCKVATVLTVYGIET